LEAAGRVESFVLEKQSAGIEADVSGDRVGALEERLAFAHRGDLLRWGERQQLAKAPDAAEGKGVGPPTPFRLKLAQAPRRAQAVPVVRNVEEAAAFRAYEIGGIE